MNQAIMITENISNRMRKFKQVLAKTIFYHLGRQIMTFLEKRKNDLSSSACPKFINS